MEPEQDRLHYIVSQFIETPTQGLERGFVLRTEANAATRNDLPHYTDRITDSLNKEFGLHLHHGDLTGAGDISELVEGATAKIL